MKRVFVDTNILIDLIADRKPFSKFAIEIFDTAGERKTKLYTSSHAIATTYYLLKKYIEEKELRAILYDLLDYIHIISVDDTIIRRSLKSQHKDFEDAIQITCASSIDKMDCIVTRNIKDFRNSEIRVLTPDEFVKQMT